MSLLTQAAWVLAAIWTGGAILTLVALARLRFIKPADEESLKKPDAPAASVLIPARNEAGRVLRESIASVLAQDYGRFEVAAIDDRSTDLTLQILRTIAEADARLRVIEGTQTPEGWLGKPHALQQGLEVTEGVWVLTTDADCLLHPSALRTAIHYARAHNCDVVSFVPHFEALSFWERVFIPSWIWGMLVIFPLDWVNRRRSRFAFGFGAFFLVRRETLESLGGFGAVRAEVIEDVRLAERLKRAGAHLRVEYASCLVSTRMYTNLRELWESAAKNLFAALKFSVHLGLAHVVWTFTVGVMPVVLLLVSLSMSLFTGGAASAWRELLALSLVAYGIEATFFGLVCRRFGIPARYGLTAALGFALACVVMLGSMLGVLTGRGVTWKGRRIYERAGIRPPRS